MRLLITGGCGFIGSHFIRMVLEEDAAVTVTNVDALTYAGVEANLAGVSERYGKRYALVKADIADAVAMERLMSAGGAGFDAVVNFAAESHVDRSIESPRHFIHSNLVGTSVLLDVSRRCGVRRFLQISTDEVYGSLGPEGRFTEASPLNPSSPYSASKAGADLLALAHHRTYAASAGQEVMITRCSNNYGPYQFPEKLIPLMIAKALSDEPLPLYGDGLQVRDWIHVEDHCRALWAVLRHGQPGAIYNIGGDGELRNREVVQLILAELGKPESLIRFVEDRPGHDRRYAIDSGKIQAELGWRPLRRPEEGIRATVAWYAAHRDWWEPLLRMPR